MRKLLCIGFSSTGWIACVLASLRFLPERRRNDGSCVYGVDGSG